MILAVPHPEPTPARPVPASLRKVECRPRITQKRIAEEAGVNRATVSLALRDIPSIPEKTRLRIKEIAQRLGYRPDPMLCALAMYREARSVPAHRGSVAWLAQTTAEHRWRDNTHLHEYYVGAKGRAEDRGYSVEVIDIGELNTTWERAASIAVARGVVGVLVSPLPHANTHVETFPWHRFSAVVFGYSLTSPLLDSVTAAHYRATTRLVRELYSRGYRRIGAALRPVLDGRLDHNFSAGYLAGCRMVGLDSLPICPDDLHQTDGSVLSRWADAFKPDAILTSNHLHLEDASRVGGLSLPPVPVVCPGLIAPRGPLPGIVEQNRYIGEVAMDLLVNAIHRGMHGPPPVQQRVLVDGAFYEGSGVPVVHSSALHTSATVRDTRAVS